MWNDLRENYRNTGIVFPGRRDRKGKTVLVVCVILLAMTAAFGGCRAASSEEELYSLDRIAERDFTGEDAREDSSAGVGTREEASEGEEAPSSLYVYVCGAVERPGMVELPEGSRGWDGVQAAGGMREDADWDSVNLAALLADGERLYIPTLEEGEALRQQEEARESGLVNINTADSGALCTLPGIGESRAADIIAYREENGAFISLEDLMKVPGIKESTYEKLKNLITI